MPSPTAFIKVTSEGLNSTSHNIIKGRVLWHAMSNSIINFHVPQHHLTQCPTASFIYLFSFTTKFLFKQKLSSTKNFLPIFFWLEHFELNFSNINFWLKQKFCFNSKLSVVQNYILPCVF